MITQKQLGQNIKRIRKSKKITQEKLAEAIDVDFGYISKLEVGQNFPSIQTLNKIAQILDVEIDTFFRSSDISEISLITEINNKVKNLPIEKQFYVYKFLKAIE